MFGITSMYLRMVSDMGLTSREQRQMVKYCILDTFVPKILYRKLIAPKLPR